MSRPEGRHTTPCRLRARGFLALRRRRSNAQPSGERTDGAADSAWRARRAPRPDTCSGRRGNDRTLAADHDRFRRSRLPRLARRGVDLAVQSGERHARGRPGQRAGHRGGRLRGRARAAPLPRAPSIPADCRRGPRSPASSGSLSLLGPLGATSLSAGLALASLHLVVGTVLVVGARRIAPSRRSVSAVWRAADALWQRNISVLVWSPSCSSARCSTLGQGWHGALHLALVAGDRRLRRRHRAAALAARPGPAPLPRLHHPGRRVLRRGHPRQRAVAAHLDPGRQRRPGRPPRQVARAGRRRSWSGCRPGRRGGSTRTSGRGCGPRRSWSLLTLLASTAFTRLLETVAELRRTRAELARVAVAEERERFSRDLHDLLGHTLSVMVVKAQAVRRLAATDPEAAAQHAADIERVGRTALLDVRQAVDAMRAPSLPEELAGARDALEAAGIRATHRGRRRRPARGRRHACWPGRCARASPTCCGTPGPSACSHRGDRPRRPHRARRRRRRRRRADATRRRRRQDRWPRRPARPGATRRAARWTSDPPATGTGWWPASPRPRGAAVIRILLAEDQAMMRGALSVLLGLEPDLEVVAEVADGADIVPTALRERPDVALLDIEMPHVSGLDAAEELSRALPECRVVIVTTFGRPGYLQRAMASRCQGIPGQGPAGRGAGRLHPPGRLRAPPWSTPSSPARRCARSPTR